VEKGRYKTVNVSPEVWRKLYELKIDWEKRSMNDVIEELIKRAEQNRGGS